MSLMRGRTPKETPVATLKPAESSFHGVIGDFVRVILPSGGRIYLQSVSVQYPIAEGILYATRDGTGGGEYTYIVMQPGMIFSSMSGPVWDNERINWINDAIARKARQQ